MPDLSPAGAIAVILTLVFLLVGVAAWKGKQMVVAFGNAMFTARIRRRMRDSETVSPV